MPLTVLYVETGTGYGGSGRSLLQLLSGLDRSRFRPVVVIYRDDGGATDAVRAMGVPVHALSGATMESSNYAQVLGRWLRHELPKAARLIRLIRRERVELIHLNNDVYSNVAGLAAGRLLGIPIVCHLRLTRRPTRLERWLGRWATVKVVLTQEAVAFYRAYWPHDEIVCIPNSVTIPLLPVPDGATLRQALKVPSDHRVVALIARCIPRKGYEEFLQAAKLVRDQLSRVSFVIFGNGPGSDEAYERRMRSLASGIGLNGELIWGGWQEDPAAVYGLPDIVVQASTTFPEGLSRVVLEAMAYGKPVVATKIVGNREAVVDLQTGLLIEPADPHALADAILTLLRDPGLAQRYGAEARQRAIEYFSSDLHAKRMSELYARLLNSSSPQSGRG